MNEKLILSVLPPPTHKGRGDYTLFLNAQKQANAPLRTLLVSKKKPLNNSAKQSRSPLTIARYPYQIVNSHQLISKPTNSKPVRAY